MTVFWGGLRQNFDRTSTKLRQNPVDENPKLSKTPLGGRAAAPKGYFVQFGLDSHKIWQYVDNIRPHAQKHLFTIFCTLLIIGQNWPVARFSSPGITKDGALTIALL